MNQAPPFNQLSLSQSNAPVINIFNFCVTTDLFKTQHPEWAHLPGDEPPLLQSCARNGVLQPSLHQPQSRYIVCDGIARLQAENTIAGQGCATSVTGALPSPYSQPAVGRKQGKVGVTRPYIQPPVLPMKHTGTPHGGTLQPLG